MYKFTKYTLGFTLIELLVVIAIIGILASVILSSLADARYQAQVASAQSELNGIYKAMEILYNDTGLYPNKLKKYCPPSSYPNNEIWLNASSSGLVATDGTYSGWNGPYIKKAIDPWGNPYRLDEDYQCLAETVGCGGVADASTDSSVIYSCGKNGDCDYDADNVILLFCHN
ncbi:MAG: prepilin-type N-terminal cleavage/methylation domain-containing protein [Candidatus Nomurabacteria bacterium]|nr:prepilin-type N-terminal cleavage/methylation domain-containing protein [Candidatus Nomurabacteria bacterium]USN88160.1 MAG: prepilin-type N-terminal cleavage/methylation domain-containing protein [Candidatus Nomurabacteria bacterium]